MALANIQQIRVLVVDSEPKITTTLTSNLEIFGDQVVVDTAHSFNEAFSKIVRDRYALLITAYELPGLNGLDLAQAVQRVSAHTRTVLMSDSGSEALRETAQLLGLAGFVEKPPGPDQLRELFQRTLEESPPVCHVLLIEANAGLRFLYGQALQEAGYSVDNACSLQEAHAVLSDNRFDIILCSLDVEGPASLRFLREQTGRLSKMGTHIIAISAEGGYRSICEELGVDFYLEMPIAVAPLVTLVDRLAAKQKTDIRPPEG